MIKSDLPEALAISSGSDWCLAELSIDRHELEALGMILRASSDQYIATRRPHLDIACLLSLLSSKPQLYRILSWVENTLSQLDL